MEIFRRRKHEDIALLTYTGKIATSVPTVAVSSFGGFDRTSAGHGEWILENLDITKCKDLPWKGFEVQVRSSEQSG